MKQTPAHNIVNNDLMSLIPDGTRVIVDVGCMHGQMAHAYKQKSPAVHYVGIEIDPDYARVASAYCDEALVANIEDLSEVNFGRLFPSDCWIFGDCLEHLKNPWSLLGKIRALIDADGCLLVCIPNAQHWGVQQRLLSGQFRYEDSGLMDKTHLRWFTRITLLEMFQETGWAVAQGFARTLPVAPQQSSVLEGIRAFAQACGLDAEMAVNDALPFQYIFKLTPV